MRTKKPPYLHHKLFRTYTAVIVVIVLVLEFYFVTSIRSEIRSNNIQHNISMNDAVSDALNEMERIADLIQVRLYENETELWDTIWYLSGNDENYLQKKLDAFSSSNEIIYKGMDDFVVESMRLSEDIESIGFYSYDHDKTTLYHSSGPLTYYAGSFLPAGSLSTYLVEEDSQRLHFFREIRNPDNSFIPGKLVITFKNRNIQAAYQPSRMNQLAVFDLKGSLLYCSDQDLSIDSIKKTLKHYFPYQPSNLSLIKDRLEKEFNSHVTLSHVGDLYIFSYIRRQDASAMSALLWITLLTVGLILFFLGELWVYFRLKNLNHRLAGILSAMGQVTEGNLDAVIPTPSGLGQDELDVIAAHFNRMCLDLKDHIQKSYLAEIEQKNAEIEALQSQINPHFLYNTLEAIRMKAISNGDKEVGKMLYGLAVIFRSQIKESNIITVAKELHYCKKYLELFEFRYQGRFCFLIECADKWMEQPVIKFIIQPIVENYFIHGIRLEDDDNRLTIRVEEEEGAMLIFVEDNGRGMSPKEIAVKNLRLNNPHDSNNSIGIANVHKRMAATYGQEYGVNLEAGTDGGLRVILRFPINS